MKYHILHSVPGTGGLTYAKKQLVTKLEKDGKVKQIFWGRYNNWRPATQYKVLPFINHVKRVLANDVEEAITDVVIYGPGVTQHPGFSDMLPLIDTVTRYYIVPEAYGTDSKEALVDRSLLGLTEKNVNYKRLQKKELTDKMSALTEKWRNHIERFYNFMDRQESLTFNAFDNFVEVDGVMTASGTPGSSPGTFDPMKMAIVHTAV